MVVQEIFSPAMLFSWSGPQPHACRRDLIGVILKSPVFCIKFKKTFSHAKECLRFYRPVGPPNRKQYSSKAQKAGRQELDLSSGLIEKITKNVVSDCGPCQMYRFSQRESMPINEC